MNLVEFGVPSGQGTICLAKSTTRFADNDLGSGSVIQLRYDRGGETSHFLAVLNWHDWNLAEFTILEFVPCVA